MVMFYDKQPNKDLHVDWQSFELEWQRGESTHLCQEQHNFYSLSINSYTIASRGLFNARQVRETFVINA